MRTFALFGTKFRQGGVGKFFAILCGRLLWTVITSLPRNNHVANTQFDKKCNAS